MSLIGYPDLDRPIAFESGCIYRAFGGGPFRLAPSGCSLASAADGSVAFRLEIVRALLDRDSHASLALTLAPQFAGDAALAHVRAIDPAATLSPCVLTDWWFRIAATPMLRVPPELAGPMLLASNGLGSARLAASLSIDSGQLLESMLSGRTALTATAEARIDGVSPRLPVVVRFDSPALLRELLALADTARELPREGLVAYFSRDIATLPLAVSGSLAREDLPRFAEAMTDRVIARFGQYVAARTMERVPLVRLATSPAAASITWTLLQPVAAERHLVLPVDLLSAAQEQVARAGLASVVERRTLASLPPLGATRVTALCNLPASRTGVEALGVTLTFPPHPPQRPQARTATAVFEPPDDTVALDVTLAPGEAANYRYSTFAVVSDDRGTREIESLDVEASGSPLRLSAEEFPVELAVVEVSPALAQVAVVTGACSWVVDGRTERRTFTLDSGLASTSVAVPRERTAASIECTALARDGSGELHAGPYEVLHVRLDLASFATYGPQQATVRCVFDDGAALRALSFLPDGLEESDANVTSLSFTPAESTRTLRWFAKSPFKPGFRFRAFDAPGGAWTAAPRGEPLLVYSSRLRQTETLRAATARSGKALRESLPRLPRRQLESAAAMPEAAVEAIATCPQPLPTDELLYTRVADTSKKLYVPRYLLDVQAVSGQQRYRISMTQGETASTLQVNLVATTAPAIADAARDAAEYPHTLAIHLEYLVAPPAGALKSLEFTDVSRNGAIVTAALTFATLQERDDVYRALTEPARAARLVVRRFIDVSLPQPTGGMTFGLLPFVVLPLRPLAVMATPVALATATFAAPAAPAPVMTIAVRPAMARKESAMAMAMAPASVALLADRKPPVALLKRPADRFVKALPEPVLSFTGKDEEPALTRLRFCVTNWDAFSDDFFAPSPDLPPGGNIKSASRTAVDLVDVATGARLYQLAAIPSAKQLADLAFTLPPRKPVPAQVRVVLTDRRTNVVRESNAVATTSPTPETPPYRATRSTLEQAVAPEPFAFSSTLHAYMFQGLVPAAGASGLVRYRFAWRGTFYTYLQDASRPSVVYCFPDRFRIARRPDAPFTPFVTLRVSSHPDGTNADVVFDYVVAPHTDAQRLADARTQLLADPRFGAAQVQFQPFASSDVRYFVDRPAVAGAVREQRLDAALVLQGALKDTLSMPLADFQLLFDAMTSRTAAMFTGRVEIDVPNGATEIIPFEARMDELEGELFSYTAAVAQDGAVQVTVRNEIESPVDVHTLDATIARGGQGVRGLPHGAPVLPHEALQPGETLQLSLSPETALPGSATPEVTFDLGGVTVHPDAAAIWNAILDRSTVDYFHKVTVKTLASTFAALDGGRTITAVLVAFEGGGTAELNAATLSADVRIDYPVDDVILGRPVDATCRYTVTVVRENGTQDHDPVPRTQSASLFYVSVVR